MLKISYIGIRLNRVCTYYRVIVENVVFNTFSFNYKYNVKFANFYNKYNIKSYINNDFY